MRYPGLRVERETRIRSVSQAQNSANGLLMRIKALHELSRRDIAVQYTSLSITMLFLTVEMAPILSKLMSSRGIYDTLLFKEEMEVILSEDIQIEQLEQEMRQENATHRKNRDTLKQIIDIQFMEASKLAATSEQMRNATESLAAEIIRKTEKELISLVSANVYMSKSNIQQAIKKATREELQNLARGIVKSRFSKAKVKNLMDKGIRDLEDLVAASKNTNKRS